jgi:hypothetical protein
MDPQLAGDVAERPDLLGRAVDEVGLDAGESPVVTRASSLGEPAHMRNVDIGQNPRRKRRTVLG